ncbi:MAG: hypothetical protein PWQ75_1906 [Methanolobus sp.]|jgi:hypothetical protein|uniref:Uncharacterized protein n=1 Tax=Methanolobus tindarius DSM 2278 TaxID=1090322 RepID=W9DNJ9_METTI|nr:MULTISPECIES: hypothetical protein [Methanolobus]ETA67689.1 hypothetical protein MettiDRAFT_1118 [Methanolobus tindarius DSM 2278]MDI3487036.1 hypothetical protein [Methanolobus sp.]MDK2832154.1 hypothetical protein [Methanolobus sp.]
MNRIFLLAAVFFLIIGFYNLYRARRDHESYLPVIVSFLILMSLTAMYFSPLLGILCLMVTFLFAISKRKNILLFQEQRLLASFNKNDYSKELKLKEVLVGNKLWGKLALEYGAKKAALIYSLWLSGSLFFILYIVHAMDTFIKPDMDFIVFFSGTYLFMSYYQMHGYFRKFLAMHEEATVPS